MVFNFSKSGVTDHYALNDKDALQIARKLVSNLNYTSPVKNFAPLNTVREPIYNPEELYGIVGTNLMKSFDVREVNQSDSSKFNRFDIFDQFTILKIQYFLGHSQNSRWI